MGLLNLEIVKKINILINKIVKIQNIIVIRFNVIVVLLYEFLKSISSFSKDWNIFLLIYKTKLHIPNEIWLNELPEELIILDFNKSISVLFFINL